jgi:hypothetical protein
MHATVLPFPGSDLKSARDFVWTAALCLHALGSDVGELALAA